MKKNLTVVLVLRQGGDYHFSDVELLTHHINKNWIGSLQILCITDTVKQVTILGNNLTLIPMPNLWNGWWSKMNMFSPEMEKYRPFLYMDLDTAVVGSLNSIFPLQDETQFVTLENVYFPGRIGSGLMWIPSNNDKIANIWNCWIVDPINGSTDTGGDQSFIEKRVMPDSFFEKVQISSFKPLPKQHWLMNVPERLKIVYFHGKPRIPDAAKKVAWVRKYLQMSGSVFTPPKVKDITKAYLINLDERKDRLKEFTNQLFPFPIERFSAIKLSPGIKGCNASHKAILEKQDALPIAVFEDDCKMVEDWSVVETAMQELPDDWDMLYIGANLNKPLTKYSEHLFRLKNAWTTHGMIYGSQRVIDYICKNMPKDETPIDVFYSKEVLEKFNCYLVNPICAIQRGSYSDINNGVRNYEELMLNNFTKNTMNQEIPKQQNFSKWFADKGDDTHRVNYVLNKNSVVFDVGGYEGSFVEKINNKYHSRIFVFEPVLTFYEKLVEKFKNDTNIKIINKALSSKVGTIKMNIDSDKSSTFIGNGVSVDVPCTTLDQAMDDLGVSEIDLLKLNIEGAEYPVLYYMGNHNLIEKCKDIQVQFHTFVDGYQEKYQQIHKELSKTHCVTYDYPFVWKNYKRMIGSKSQVGQDLFAISMFGKDFKGTFLDVGCYLPDKINNTLLLEEMGWNGFSLDIEDYSKEWKSRKTKFIQANALTYQYAEVPKLIDYLTLDLEGTGVRYKALKRLIDFGFEFKVITIEHDAYRGLDKEERQPQRDLLLEKGYQLVFPDVHHNGCAFEDWWINPKYIAL